MNDNYATKMALSAILLGLAMPGCAEDEAEAKYVHEAALKAAMKIDEEAKKRQAAPPKTEVLKETKQKKQEQVEDKEDYVPAPLRHGKFWKRINRNRSRKTRISETDQHRLEDIIHAEHNILHPNILMGLLHAESRFDLAIGCNRSRACGPAQMKEVAVGDTLMMLYAGNGPYESFREEFAPQLEMKRSLVDAVTDSHFSELQKLYRGAGREKEKIRAEIRKVKADIRRVGGAYRDVTRKLHTEAARVRRLGRNWVKNKEQIRDHKLQFQLYLGARRDMGKELQGLWRKRKQLAINISRLWYVRTAIDAGYITNHTGGIRRRRKHMQYLRELGNEYLSGIAGEQKDWIDLLDRQRSMVNRVYRLTHDKKGAELNMLLADTLLGYYVHSRGSLTKSFKKYNSGTKKAQHWYAKDVDRFYARNRRYIREPKKVHWLRKNPYFMAISRSDGKR